MNKKTNGIKVFKKDKEYLYTISEINFINEYSGLKFLDGNIFYMWKIGNYKSWKYEIEKGLRYKI